MGEDEIQETETQKKKVNNKVEEKLPPCIVAPSAEHARSNDSDEPCDDGRAGQID
jgi:hypothetical protein